MGIDYFTKSAKDIPPDSPALAIYTIVCPRTQPFAVRVIIRARPKTAIITRRRVRPTTVTSAIVLYGTEGCLRTEVAKLLDPGALVVLIARIVVQEGAQLGELSVVLGVRRAEVPDHILPRRVARAVAR